MRQQRVRTSSVGLAVFAVAGFASAHGTISGSRIEQVYKGGPSGTTPAAFNTSYYTWNQNSNNFPGYAAANFSYSNVIADGKIANAGINDGVNAPLNFSGLNTPSSGWKTTAATAGQPLSLTWIATAPHDPSFFQIFLTKPGYDVTTQPLTWASLQDLGRWESGTGNPVTSGPGPNTISGGTGTLYNFAVPIPTDRTGRESLVVIWQRRDPAGEAFVSVSDLQITPTVTILVATWKGPAGAGGTGAWSAAANWSTNAVPNGDTFDAVIDAGNAAVSDVTVSTAAVRHLTVDIGDTLHVASASAAPALSVNGNVLVNGTIEVNASSAGAAALKFVGAGTGATDPALAGGGTVRLNGAAANAASIVNDGSLRKITVASGVSIDGVGAAVIDGWFDNNAALAVSGSGRTLTLQGASAAKPFTQNGNITVSGDATVRLGANVVRNGTLDVRGGRAQFTYSGAANSPAASIRATLAAGYATNFASGSVFSSSAVSGVIGLGYRDDGSSTVTVMRTYYGDVDLDGRVLIGDFNAFAPNFGAAGGKVWSDGDFNYDGNVNIGDFNLLAANFGKTLPSAADWQPLLAFAAAHDDLSAFAAATGVPEPATLGLLSIATAAGLRRTRK